MPSSYYTDKLTLEEVLELIKKEAYAVDFEEGKVFNGSGVELTIRYKRGKNKEYPTVRFWKSPKQIEIAVSAVVWMIGNDCLIPEDFEIHHIDKDPTNNAFNNLIALHRNDHRDKVHFFDTLREDF